MNPMDEFVADVDAAIERGEVRMVFWTCVNEGHRGVTWERTPEGAVPTCDTCGVKGLPR
jgi:hypothetical protein